MKRPCLIGVGALFLLAILIGAVESSMARLRFNRIPQFMVGALAFATIALMVTLRGNL